MKKNKKGFFMKHCVHIGRVNLSPMLNVLSSDEYGRNITFTGV